MELNDKRSVLKRASHVPVRLHWIEIIWETKKFQPFAQLINTQCECQYLYLKARYGNIISISSVSSVFSNQTRNDGIGNSRSYGSITGRAVSRWEKKRNDLQRCDTSEGYIHLPNHIYIIIIILWCPNISPAPISVWFVESLGLSVAFLQCGHFECGELRLYFVP